MAKKRATGRKRAQAGLTVAQAKALSKILKEHLPLFDDNHTIMARAWRISQPQLSQLISMKGRGAGVAVLCRIRAATRLSIDELLGLDKASPLNPTLQDRVRRIERELDLKGAAKNDS